MVPIAPITESQFVYLLRRCTPPTGWPQKIAVAYSAGADSTCLLFLLQQLAQSRQYPDLPREIHALFVNHRLQPANNDMAKVARRTAQMLGAVDHEVSIPWGVDVYPPKPGPGEPLEELARNARYQTLFEGMGRRGTDVIAFGHHADDQVETALMRWARGSTTLGLAGMRGVRRWGMGFGKDQNTVGWFGTLGMKRWIVRLLLPVSKDRILATCEEHKLNYVNDPTNFQPDLTPRNAIRHALSQMRGSATNSDGQAIVSSLQPPPNAISQQMHALRTTNNDVSRAPVPFDVTGDIEDLRQSVQEFHERVGDVEDAATACLDRFSVSSPPATFLLAAGNLHTIENGLTRTAMILRILRYISPAPWGSVTSQAGRRTDSLNRIVSRVFNSEPPASERVPFVAGANVLWTPLRIRTDGRLKHFAPLPNAIAGPAPASEPDVKEEDAATAWGWIASRAPPAADQRDATTINLSEALVSARRIRKKWRRKIEGGGEMSVFEILWDNRFNITFNLDRMPPALSKALGLEDGRNSVVVYPETRWMWPRVVWKREGKDDVLLARITVPEMVWYTRFDKRTRYKVEQPYTGEDWLDWVDIEFIRTKDAI
ncbi:hypothetical protein OF83DRAFT_1243578 [Amylostereum chailletii]|nr:hypothetical protein OF83DRAFT_1243578 [Amylostereum chailletii]